MKREDFLFTIGYQGSTAIVDVTMRRRHGRKSAVDLLDAGLYRAAFCAALYDDQLESFVGEFTARTGIDAGDGDALRRLFGVSEVPTNVDKVVAIG